MGSIGRQLHLRLTASGSLIKVLPAGLYQVQFA